MQKLYFWSYGGWLLVGKVGGFWTLLFYFLQAFGVGAFEDEDDDIYGVDSLSNYDISMSKEDENCNHGWSGGPKNEIKKGQNFFAYIWDENSLYIQCCLHTQPCLMPCYFFGI